MQMTDGELRRKFSTDLLAASIGLGLMLEGLQGRLEPSVLSDRERAAFHDAVGDLSTAGEKMAALALELRG
jgi:hypothetical protein